MSIREQTPLYLQAEAMSGEALRAEIAALEEQRLAIQRGEMGPSGNRYLRMRVRCQIFREEMERREAEGQKNGRAEKP